MLISGIWAYIVLEALVVASLYILYLRWANRRLKRATASPPAAAVSPATSPIDQYVTLLQEQIRDADAKLAQLEAEPANDTRLTEIVGMRLAFLRAERKAIDGSASDPQKLWNGIAEALGPLLPDPAAAAASDSQARLVNNALQARLQAYETRVANLEQFRTNFFELKEKYADAIGLGQQLHSEVGKAFSEDQQPPELRAAMDELKEENSRLEGQLSLVEQEFDNIMRNLQTATDRSDLPPAQPGIASSMDNIGQGVAKIRGVIRTQEHRIHELTGVISELEIELSDKERLDSAVDELKQKHTELTNVIAIIQDENDFLQEQISALLKQELEDREKSDAKTDALRQELEEQRDAYIELEKKYAAIEHEYLAAYEENKRLKG